MSIQVGGRAPTSYRRIIITTLAAIAVLLLISSFFQDRIPHKFSLTSDPLSSDKRPPSSRPYDLDPETPHGSAHSPYSPQNAAPKAAPNQGAEQNDGSQSSSTQKHKGRRRKAAVFATIKKRDRTWMKNITSDWEIFDYVSDDANAKYTVPINYGREAMVYLTYIIDHYDDLPDIVVFAHGHNRAWHQPAPFPYILEALNLDAVEDHGWVNLRCTLNPSCIPAPGTWVKTHYAPPGDRWWSYITRGLFSHVFRPGDPWYNETIPDLNGLRIPPLFASPCCAQFAVSKATVLSRPLAFWKRAREPIMGNPQRLNPKWWPGADPDMGQGITQWNIGVAYERTWHYLFGKEPITCLDEEYCHKVLYQDRIHCNGETSTWEKSQNFDWIACDLRDGPHN